jgi:hypothetical protein
VVSKGSVFLRRAGRVGERMLLLSEVLSPAEEEEEEEDDDEVQRQGFGRQSSTVGKRGAVVSYQLAGK